MTGTIITAITTLFIIVGAWTVDLVCYHTQQAGLDPTTAPTNLTVTWNQ